jgi:hypothetical protein
MRFASVSATVDVLEIIQLIACLIAFGGFCLLIRQSWVELVWSMEDHSSFMRWLGAIRFATCFLYGVAAVAMLINILIQMTVPSAMNDSEVIIDVVAAIGQRVTSTVVILVLGAVMLLDRTLRQRAIVLRESTRIVSSSDVRSAEDAEIPHNVAVSPTS